MSQTYVNDTASLKPSTLLYKKAAEQKKLLFLPGATASLGGTLVTLSLLIKGFEIYGNSTQLCVLVRADSPLENYLKEAGQEAYLKSIPAEGHQEFVELSLKWVSQQPAHYPLWLDNCVTRKQLPILLRNAPALRFSGRPIYHFFHDLALSRNLLGNLARKVMFMALAPESLCNSRFTAAHAQKFVGTIQHILYQPVDSDRFNNHPSEHPPALLQPILNSRARLILTPSRISNPGIVNDKNLRALIPVLAHLRLAGHHYHLVIIGDDRSPGQSNTRALLEEAEKAGVAKHFTILPPTYAIEDFYKHADIVVTLAPREPFGRVVVEALACGVPVVGSNTGGIGEILSHFAPEWTTNPNNAEEVAKTIARVLDNPATPSTLIQAQDWVKSRCSVMEYVQRVIKITQLNSTP